MPRLVLLDDDGRELGSGAVSRENVERVAHFLRQHMGTLQAAAQFKRALDGLFQIGDILEVMRKPLPPARPRAPRAPRGGGRR